MRCRASQIRGGEKYSRSATLEVNMYAHALIRASFGFVGLCLVAFVQQSASGSRTTPGRRAFFLVLVVLVFIRLRASCV